MKTRTCRGFMALVGCLCLLAALAGCDSDGDDKPPVLVVTARVIDEADRSPVPGIKVMVMDPRFNTPVAGPFISDADGQVNLGILPETDMSLMVFGGVGYLVHSLPGYGTLFPGAQVSGDGRIPSRSLLAPDSESGLKVLAAPLDIQVRRTIADSLPRIAGLVVDSADGRPLKQVFVGMSPYLTGHQGETGPSDDVTGTDGMFSVSQIPFTQDPQTGNLIQINPLRFTCNGFRPVVWKYDAPNGSDNLDISGVTIEMELLDPDHKGVITGVLMRDGLPAVDVVIGLGVVDQSTGNKAGPGMVGWVEKTDEFGRFIFGHVPPGTYIIQPGFALGDGVFYTPQPGNPPITIVGNQVFNVGTLNILHEIEPRDPPHGQVLPTPPTSLSWTAVPGATTYEVRFDRGVLPLTTTNSIDLPESLVISEGLHVWYVRALDKEGALVGFSQIQSIFRLLPPVD
ncbi:MAG: hypothetical protein ABFS42_11225 [Candidatus Krumholzibacteriota bacterium]